MSSYAASWPIVSCWVFWAFLRPPGPESISWGFMTQKSRKVGVKDGGGGRGVELAGGCLLGGVLLKETKARAIKPKKGVRGEGR